MSAATGEGGAPVAPLRFRILGSGFQVEGLGCKV